MLIDARNGRNLWNLCQVRVFLDELITVGAHKTPDMRAATSLFFDRSGQASKTRRGVWKYIIPSIVICVLLLLPPRMTVRHCN